MANYVSFNSGETGANVRSRINNLGLSSQLAIKVCSEFANIDTEVGYSKTNSIVYCIVEDAFFKFDGEFWLLDDTFSTGSQFSGLKSDFETHVADVSNPHVVTAEQVGSPALVSPSVINNIVTFSNTAGLQKDSGTKIADLVAKSGSTMTGTLTAPLLVSTSGVKMGTVADAASIDNVGTARYRVSGNNSYLDVCMQTGVASYAWINIIQNNW